LTQSHNTGGIGASNQELFSQRGDGLVPDICGCLSDGAHNGGGLNGQDAYTGRIIPVQTYDMRGNGDGETVGTLTGDHVGRPTDYTPVVCCSAEITGPLVSGHSPKGHGCAGVNGQDAYSGRIIPVACPSEVALLSGGDGAPCVAFDTTQITSPGNYSRPKQGDPCHPLASGAHPPCVAIQDVRGLDKKQNGRGYNADGTSYTVDAMATQGVANAMQVRRLTPRECERLQGLPDDWTLIPWRGKSAADCPDGPRYKGIGNGQTVNVMRWLAERIKKAIAV